MEVTDESLILKLKRMDAGAAWRTFFERYSVAMLCYSQKLGLNENEAEDAVQETMITLMRVLPRFVYNKERGRFRNYLLTILHRRSLQILRQRKPALSVDNIDLVEPSEGVMPDDDFDKHWRASLVAAAWKRLCDSGVLDERTIKVFDDLCFKEISVTEVSALYGLSANTIYQIKHRVISRISVDVDRLSVELE